MVSKEKILLVGGSGVLGEQIAKSLSEEFQIVIFDRNKRTDFETIQFDILDSEKFKKEFNKYKFKAAIHLISSKSVSSTENNFEDSFKRNVESLRNLLSCCDEKIKVIFISSTAVYGNQPIPHSENLLPKPSNLYGLFKYLCEEILIKNCLEKKIDYTILRLPGIYCRGNRSILIENIFESIKNKQKLEVYNLNQIRDYVHIEDVLSSIKKTLESPNSRNQIINVSSGVPYKLKEIVDMFKDFKENFNFVNKLGGYDSLADITKLKKLYGINPSKNIKEDIILRVHELKKSRKI
jgi:nucleoside-diphosphate-sugar epimerase